MEKFMLLFEGPMPAPEAASPEAMQEIMGKWFAWIEKLSKDGLQKEKKSLVAFLLLMPGIMKKLQRSVKIFLTMLPAVT